MELLPLLLLLAAAAGEKREGLTALSSLLKTEPLRSLLCAAPELQSAAERLVRAAPALRALAEGKADPAALLRLFAEIGAAPNKEARNEAKEAAPFLQALQFAFAPPEQSAPQAERENGSPLAPIAPFAPAEFVCALNRCFA